ncbi:MAG TPA: bile acid:sodium symporter family protein [Solirubrobacterales bacterium]
MEDQSLVAEIVLPISLVVIMVSLGLGLTTADFRRVIVYPKGVAIGLANLLLISPLLAFGMAELFALPAALAVGIVLLGASPGGATANMMTHLARGDVALSVTMTAISSVCAVVTVPVFLGLAVEHFGSGLESDPEMLGIVARVFLITLIPLATGMFVRARRPAWTERNYDKARKAAIVVLVLAIAVAVAVENDRVLDNFTDVAGATIALNVVAMTISFTVAKLARLSDPQATAISMELGIHNATLAIAVAATISTQLAIPAAVYSSFMFVTAGIFARIMYRRNGGGAESAVAPATSTP